MTREERQHHLQSLKATWRRLRGLSIRDRLRSLVAWPSRARADLRSQILGLAAGDARLERRTLA